MPTADLKLPIEKPAEAYPTYRRQLLVFALLLSGIAGWFYLFGLSVFATLGPWPAPYLLVYILIIAAVLCIGPVRLRLASAWAAIRVPSPSSRRAIAIGSGITSAAYLYFTACRQARSLTPYLHDEFSYLIQAHQLAHGHLWMPPHPLGQFFDSFQLIVYPVYASAYFPGTALLNVPGIWLHCPPWVTSLLISASVICLLCRITSELIDGVASLLAVLLLLSCQMFRELSFMTMGQLPVLLFGLLAVLALLKWRSTGRTAWSFLMGMALGLASITRPLDSLCYIIPTAAGFLFDLRHRHNRRKKLAFALLGASPMIVLQILCNFGVTGHFLETPFRLYADQEYPNTSFGFHRFDPDARPISSLPQQQDLYRDYLPIIQLHQPINVPREMVTHRLPLLLGLASSTPFPILAILIPVSAAGMNKPRAVVLAGLILFAALYALYVFFFPHYVITAAPAIILAILTGAGQLPNLFPKIRISLTMGITLMIAGLAVTSLPQFDSSMKDEMFEAPLIRSANAQLSHLNRAVVLFRYSRTRNIDEEPVYNADVAWPDDAPVIRAHDRGPANSQIFHYYADRQPDRTFYLFDESDNSLHLLGNARQIAVVLP